MPVIEKGIEINVPSNVAYDQWTQFEEFPKFMADVESVRQIDDTHLHWRARVGGKLEEWNAEITEQIPDKRIAWKSTSGAKNCGVVTFHRLSDDRSRVMLQLEYEPTTATEKIGDWFGVMERRVARDLEGFRFFIEQRGAPTGEWRGSVEAPPERGSGSVREGERMSAPPRNPV